MKFKSLRSTNLLGELPEGLRGPFPYAIALAVKGENKKSEEAFVDINFPCPYDAPDLIALMAELVDALVSGTSE